ncbi:lysosomal acid glucosylceramidase-like isoform X2 [Patagioenas fasciata]|uniref:lysosomal acid glucosylceramidase-like isoform X2 n=1 Tax=Patagioenas fasciata TaxID=372321 RepID=UPI003A9A0D9F
MGAAGALGWLLLLLPCAAGARPCSPKHFGRDAMVCVCNATYCDTLDPVVLPAAGTYIKYESSKAGKRLERSQGSFQHSLRAPGLLLMLDVSVLYQRVKGFGGSLSDAAALNILGLSQPAQDNLLCSYFSEYGIEYNLVRLPMACSDFSVRPYSYDDVPYDYELKHFSLAEEDVKMKIPLLHRASAMSRRPLALYASPWTAPAWIKSNRDVRGTGTLRGRAGDKCHKTWANYFIKFLDEYAKHNVSFWAVTVQNEPRARNPTFPQFPTISFTAEQQRDFIVHDLGPALARSPHRTRLLILDDQRTHLPQWAETVLGNSTAAGYVAGVAVHWYLDGIVSATCSLGVTHKLFPDHFLLYTEACNGFLSRQFSVALGCWERGERYSHSILTVLNHFVTGWTDWNLALDLQGGPNWVKNYVDSPVIVDSSKDVFYKQPMFYHLGHFSKFIPEGSRRVGLRSIHQNPSCPLERVAFLRPDGAVVLVVLNRSGDGLGGGDTAHSPLSPSRSPGPAGMCHSGSATPALVSSRPFLQQTPSRRTCGGSSDTGQGWGQHGAVGGSPGASYSPRPFQHPSMMGEGGDLVQEGSPQHQGLRVLLTLGSPHG